MDQQLKITAEMQGDCQSIRRWLFGEFKLASPKDPSSQIYANPDVSSRLSCVNWRLVICVGSPCTTRIRIYSLRMPENSRVFPDATFFRGR